MTLTGGRSQRGCARRERRPDARGASDTSRHDEAVVRAEMKRIVYALGPFGVYGATCSSGRPSR